MLKSWATVLTGSVKGLKRQIAHYVDGRPGNCVLSTVLSSGVRVVIVLLEGDATDIDQVKNDLCSYLTNEHPNVEIGHWDEFDVATPITDSGILPTNGSLSKDSSGYFEEASGNPPPSQPWEELAANILANKFHQALTFAQSRSGRRVVDEIMSSIGSIVVKPMALTHRDLCVTIDIGQCITWEQFVNCVTQSSLKITPPFKVYRLVDGEKSYLQEVVDILKDEKHVYLETKGDEVGIYLYCHLFVIY